MRDYFNLILNKLLDVYERRGGYDANRTAARAVQIEPAKEYKEYVDRYDYDTYRAINAAIEKLEQQNLVSAISDMTGKYIKIKLNIAMVANAYAVAKRESIPDLCNKMHLVLEEYKHNESGTLQQILADFQECLRKYRKLPYDIKFDDYKLHLVMRALRVILDLKQETYIRNFSTAVFQDSKLFQNMLRSTVESILFDYTDTVVEKGRILEVYNLVDTPSYVLIKGDAILKYENSYIRLADMDGGIAIPNSALENLLYIEVKVDNIVTVENLTTYHDCCDNNSVFVYLGGFHNQTKQIFLKRVYLQNPNKVYYHKGDIDVYGFLILENLRGKTEIPFTPLEMDIATLERFYKSGLYKELTENDKKLMRSEKLQKYSEVFGYMLEHNCKVEQESIKAVEIMADVNV